LFIHYISEFVKFLSIKDHTLEEILARMILRDFKEIEATSIFLSELNNENMIQELGRFGIGHEMHDRYQSVYDVNDKYPITDAITERKTSWITTLPQWPEEYPKLKDLPYDSGEKTFICFPIEKSGSPVAVLGIFCKPVIQPDVETDAFLKAMGHLLSLYIYQNNKAQILPPSFSQVSPARKVDVAITTPLTERQFLILRMVSEGRTNLAISEYLGYSASTIRQETIKIYSNLQCNGRLEASEIFLRNQASLTDKI